jgi:hypothetical protein
MGIYLNFVCVSSIHFSSYKAHVHVTCDISVILGYDGAVIKRIPKTVHSFQSTSYGANIITDSPSKLVHLLYES